MPRHNQGATDQSRWHEKTPAAKSIAPLPEKIRLVFGRADGLVETVKHKTKHARAQNARKN